MGETQDESLDNQRGFEKLYPPASPRNQAAATVKFLLEAARQTYVNVPGDISSEETKERDNWHLIYHDLISLVQEQIDSAEFDETRASTLIDLAVKTAQLSGIEMMKKANLSHVSQLLAGKDSSLVSTYQRELGVSGKLIEGVADKRVGVLFMNPSELANVIAGHQSYEVRGFKAPGPNPENNIQILNRQISSERVRDVIYSILRDVDVGPKGASINYQYSVPFVVGDGVAGLITIGNSLASIGNPQSELPLEQILKAFLKKGIFPISVDAPVPVSEPKVEATNQSQLNIDEFEGKIRGIERRLIKLGYKTNPARAAGLKKALLAREKSGGELSKEIVETFYQRELASDLNDKVVVTRSGVSANQFALLASLRFVGDTAKVFEAEGFYYENTAKVNPILFGRDTKNLEDSQVLMLITEPNAPILDRQDYDQYRNNLLIKFLNLARANPDKKYSVVLDKTFDPSFTISDALPDNLTVVETISLTKYQRGNTNSFAGAAIVKNNWLDEDQIESMISMSRGTVSSWNEMAKVSLKTMIAERLRVRKKVKAIVDNPEFKDWAEKNNLQIIPGSFFFYIVTKRDSALPSKLKTAIRNYQVKGLDLIEYGDSFNLNKNRITMFGAAIDRGILVDTKNVIRISPSRNSAHELVHEEIGQITRLFKDLFGEGVDDEFNWGDEFENF